jgi:hypothetical protein
MPGPLDGASDVLAASHPLCRFVPRSGCSRRLWPEWRVSPSNPNYWEAHGNRVTYFGYGGRIHQCRACGMWGARGACKRIQGPFTTFCKGSESHRHSFNTARPWEQPDVLAHPHVWSHTYHHLPITVLTPEEEAKKGGEGVKKERKN